MWAAPCARWLPGRGPRWRCSGWHGRPCRGLRAARLVPMVRATIRRGVMAALLALPCCPRFPDVRGALRLVPGWGVAACPAATLARLYHCGLAFLACCPLSWDAKDRPAPVRVTTGPSRAPVMAAGEAWGERRCGCRWHAAGDAGKGAGCQRAPPAGVVLGSSAPRHL